MNTIDELQSRCEALARELSALQTFVADLRSRSDPFAAHVFTARRRFRAAALHDTKSGKRAEREAWDSYGRATRLGFRGTLHEWMQVLHAHEPG